MDTTVGSYTLGDPLGLTAFGELFEATHAARSEPLALLRLDERLAQDTRFRGLLRLENARAGGLRHPGIARTVEIVEARGGLYLAIERPPICLTLDRALESGGPLTGEDVVRMVRPIAEGLDAAHTRRLVHGAIDPTCVLTGADGEVKLVGLGILAAAEEAGLVGVVAERQGPTFVAPEQQGGPRIVASADAFALGALAAALVRKHPGPTDVAEKIAPVLDRQRLADPSSRYPTGSAFVAALAEATAGSAPSTTAQSPIVTVPTAPSAPASPAIPRAPSLSAAPSAPAAVNPAPLRAPVEPAPVSPPLLSPPPAAPPDISPAPWDAPASAEPPAPAPAVPAPTPAGAKPIQPHPDQPADLGSWVRALIDPPRPASPQHGPRAPQPSPIERVNDLVDILHAQHQAGTQAAANARAASTRIPLSLAMLACQQGLERRDPLGDALRWVTRSAPALDNLLDRYAPNGKVGPVPVGIAMAGVLALLFLVLGQVVFTTAMVLMVVVFYGIPPLVDRLTKAEQQQQGAIRVTGPATIRRRQIAPGWDLREIELTGGLTLSLDQSGYALLAAVGQPVTVERPSPVSAGTDLVTLAYELPEVMVTYLEAGHVLLDVRNPDGSVLLRHSGYEGEPGDTLAPPPVVKELVVAPKWEQSNHGRTVTLPMTAPIREALEQDRQIAIRKAAGIVAIPLIVVIALTLADGGGLIPVAVLGMFAIYIWFGSQAVDRVLRLKTASEARELRQVIGPSSLMSYGGKSAPLPQIHLEDETVLTIDSATYTRLASIGQLRMADSRTEVWGKRPRTNYVKSVHELPSLTVTFEPLGPLLLEIANPFGEVLYRDPGLGAAEIAHPRPVN